MESRRIKFLFNDLYEDLITDGIIISEKQLPNQTNFYIIGIDKNRYEYSGDRYNFFMLCKISESQIIARYISLFGENKLKLRRNQQSSNRQLLLEIIDYDSENINHRIENIVKFFPQDRYVQLTLKKVLEIIEVPKVESKYKHIDINLGVKFNDDEK